MNKTPAIEDFANPELRRAAIDVLGCSAEHWDGMERKLWEWAQVVAAAERHGMLDRQKSAISIGAGFELPVFVLASKLRICCATDLYGDGRFKGLEASPQMMRNPAALSPRPFDRQGLLVARMDACRLAFGDDSFDFAFSCSSIEHFGSLRKIAKSMQEVYRVLRPGGIYALAVDYLFDLKHDRPRHLRRGQLREFLTKSEVEDAILNSTGFEVDGPIDYTVDRSQLHNVYDLDVGAAESGEFLPHLWLKTRGSYLTSLFITLRKPH